MRAWGGGFVFEFGCFGWDYLVSLGDPRMWDAKEKVPIGLSPDYPRRRTSAFFASYGL